MRSSRYSSESGSSVIHACYEVHVYLTVTEGVGFTLFYVLGWASFRLGICFSDTHIRLHIMYLYAICYILG